MNRGTIKKKWFALGCFTSIVLVILALLVTGYVAHSFFAPAERLPEKFWLHIVLQDEITEYSEIAPFYPDWTHPLTVHELRTKLARAASDPSVAGVLLEPRLVRTGYAACREIGEAIQDFRNADKPVIAYLAHGGNKEYFISSYASRIVMPPSSSASLAFTGMGGSMIFMKEMLDHIGVDMKVFHAGAYKGTGETFSRDGMSDALRQNMKSLINGLYPVFVETIAHNRDSLDLETVQYLFEQRDDFFIRSSSALEEGLIDERLHYRDLLLEYGLNDEKLVSCGRYNPEVPVGKEPDKIAVVYSQGPVGMGRSGLEPYGITTRNTLEIIEQIQRDPSVKAVVFRVNSGGGSSLVSEEIHDAIDELREHKKVVVSFGDVAASGGYLISCGADWITADPLSVTGSIGVVAMFPNFSELGRKIGLHSDGVARGRFTDITNPWQPMNPAFEHSIQTMIDTIYRDFKNVVARDRELADIDSIAQGRVYSGNQALQIGLVDSLGGLSDAIVTAAGLADLKRYSVEFFPKQKNLIEVLLEEEIGIARMNKEVKDLLLESLIQRFHAERVEVLLEVIEQNPIQMLSPVGYGWWEK